MNSKSSGNSTSRMLIGSLFILLGGIFLLENLDIIYFNIPHIIFSFPTILIVIGSIIMINSRRKTFGGIVLALGLFLMVPRIFPAIDYDASIIFPLIIILLGIFIIFRNKHEGGREGENIFHGSKGNINRDKIDEISIFGGGERIINSDNFMGGNVTSIFGGSEIDLTKCKLAPGENIVDLLSIFGGSTFIVPKDWNIVTDVFPLFGGFSNKVIRDPNVATDKEKTLVIKGLVIFGGGEIKSYY